MHENTLLTKLLIISLVATVIVGVAQLYYGFSNSMTSSKTDVDNSEKNEIKKVEEQNIPDDFFVSSFVKRIEQNNNLSREDKDKLIESYLYNENIKADLKNTGYLNDIGNNKVKASFEIDKDGYISNYRILESSNNENVDKKVLKAIKNLNPYKPLPAIFNGESKYVEFAYSNDGFSGFTTYPANNPRALEELNAWTNKASGKPAYRLSKVADKTNTYTAKSNGEIDVLGEPDFGPYMRQLQRRIKMNWDPPKRSETKRVVTSFRLNRDGTLLSSYIKQSSGDSSADRAALKAIAQAAPFRPFPPDSQKEYIDIQFTFDYNVLSVAKQ